MWFLDNENKPKCHLTRKFRMHDLAQSLYIISVNSYFFVSYCLLFRK